MVSEYESIKIIYKDKCIGSNLLSISVDKLFELYGNLVMAGFSESEAIQIVSKVVLNDINQRRTF